MFSLKKNLLKNLIKAKEFYFTALAQVQENYKPMNTLETLDLLGNRQYFVHNKSLKVIFSHHIQTPSSIKEDGVYNNIESLKESLAHFQSDKTKKIEFNLEIFGFLILKYNQTYGFVRDFSKIFSINERENIIHILNDSLNFFDNSLQNNNYYDDLFIIKFISLTSRLSLIFKIDLKKILLFIKSAIDHLLDKRYLLRWEDLEIFGKILCDINNINSDIENDPDFNICLSIIKDSIIDLGKKESSFLKLNVFYKEMKGKHLLKLLFLWNSLKRKDKELFKCMFEFIFSSKQTISFSAKDTYSLIAIIINLLNLPKWDKFLNEIPAFLSNFDKFIFKGLNEGSIDYKHAPLILEVYKFTGVNSESKNCSNLNLIIVENYFKYSKKEIFSMIESILKIEEIELKSDFLKVLVSCFYVSKSKNLSFFTELFHCKSLLIAIHLIINDNESKNDKTLEIFKNMKALLIRKYISVLKKPRIRIDKLEELLKLCFDGVISENYFHSYGIHQIVFNLTILNLVKDKELILYSKVFLKFCKKWYVGSINCDFLPKLIKKIEGSIFSDKDQESMNKIVSSLKELNVINF